MSQNQRRDDVSAKLGSLLLKGYKMLADSCPDCSNVLMQDKKGLVICVNCNASGPKPVEVDAGNAHKLPAHGYSDGFPYRVPTEKEGPPEGAYYAEGVLLREIKAVALQLEKGRDQKLEDTNETLKDGQVKMEYIRQCAETIKSLQGIRM